MSNECNHRKQVYMNYIYKVLKRHLGCTEWIVKRIIHERLDIRQHVLWFGFGSHAGLVCILCNGCRNLRRNISNVGKRWVQAAHFQLLVRHLGRQSPRRNEHVVVRDARRSGCQDTQSNAWEYVGIVSCAQQATSNKQQATSNKQQATSKKQKAKSKKHMNVSERWILLRQ
jgi:hypothetical protein